MPLINFNSIKTKLAITNISVLVLLTGLTFYLIVKSNLDRLREELILEVDTYKVFISQDLVKIVVFDSVDIASDLTTRLRSFKKINSLVVYDGEKQASFYYIRNDSNQSYNRPDNFSDHSFFYEKSYVQLSELNYLGNHYGYVYIDVSTENINQELYNYKIQVLFFIIALIIASIALALLFNYFVSNPITKLIDALRYIGKTGDFTSLLKIRRNDEIGELFTGFNNMQKAIQVANKDLDDQKFALDEHAIVAITDIKGDIIYANKKFSQISGYKQKELLGKNHRILNSGKHPTEFFTNMYHEIANGKVWHGEICNKAKDGHLYWVDTSIIPVMSAQGKPERYISIRTDITELKTIQRKAEYLAEHDVLTDLPNRVMITNYLGKAIERANRHKSKLALLYMDLNKFKAINDTLGHEIGDKVLIHVSNTLKTNFRKMDFIARHAGDEFIAIIEDVNNETMLPHLLNKVINSIEEPFVINHKQMHVGISIGISLFPGDAFSADELFIHADAAMYKAKEHGHSNFQFYTKDLNQNVLNRYKLETELREAIKNDELFCVFQPKVDLTSGEVIGAEVLSRWKNTEGKFISPAEFIPLAETCGLINDIWLTILHQSIKFANKLHKINLKIPLALNISPIQFNYGHVLNDISQVLEQYSLSPDSLQIEITESLLIDSQSMACETLKQLSSKGIKIAIDDFGTGYSSLKYLKEFPIDYVKLDLSFISGIGLNSDDEKLIKTMIDMSVSLDKEVIAEGIETEKQRDFLLSLGCHFGQGYFYSKPLTSSDFLKFITPGDDNEKVISLHSLKNS